jgi:phage shock protein C
MNERLYRSRQDRMIAGVAGGVAEALRLDSSLVRIIWAILIPLSGGFMLLLYLVMAIVVPERPRRAADDLESEAADDAAIVAEPTERMRGNAGILLGAVLIFLGIWFLADEYLDIDFGRLWPIAIIGLGVLLLLVALRRD